MQAKQTQQKEENLKTNWSVAKLTTTTNKQTAKKKPQVFNGICQKLLKVKSIEFDAEAEKSGKTFDLDIKNTMVKVGVATANYHTQRALKEICLRKLLSKNQEKQVE